MLSRLRTRLVVRLYVAGLVQLLAIAVVFQLISSVVASPVRTMMEHVARFASNDLCARAGDPSALEQELTRLRDELGLSVSITDSRGQSVARTGGPADAGIPAPELGASCTTPQGERLAMRYRVMPLEPPAPLAAGLVLLVLTVIAGPAWFTARSIARPLARMGAAARAFGQGNLEARVGLHRPDELGDVGAAFDQMADRVVHLLRAEKELLANVSHELRTPLARIRVALDLAAEGTQLEHESLQDVARDLAELERIVGDVLATARLTVVASGPSLPLRLEDADPADVVHEAVARFMTLHPTRPLSVAIEPALPTLPLDRVLVRRVVDNLLDNAHTYTEDPQATIGVEARREGDEVVIEVVDPGAGMSEADLARAFEPFFRSDRSRSRATGGLGLGLALSRRIVEAHGGAISLSSRPGQGTRACVRLRAPVSRPSLDPARQGASAPGT